jgi:hypothetical protein
MAKQTFTTGQVLSAAQMTSLQQTAMGGGSTTAKTASYTLVAADAGTVVQMNSASATTITVNTALFAAGDTVQIQNIGAGVCTVTAGTATVNTAGSLALSQYEGGQLYFNTTSAALFFDIVQSATASFTTSLATVATDQTTTSTSYVDLATAGPAVTVTTGTKVLVSVKASMANGAASTGQLMGVAVSGATTLAASDTYAAGYKYIATVNFQPVFAATFLIEGLTAGSNTFTAKYRSATGDTVYFKERMISVVNLGS